MNVSLPSVSAIIPFYRNTAWLSEALESVAAQTWNDIEVIVVNDGSDEDISPLQDRYRSFRFLESANFGAAAARNRGIAASSGEFICFLDSDDLWAPDKVEKQVLFMIQRSLVWCHTGYATFQNGNQKQLTPVDTTYYGWILPQMIISCPVATPCVMIRADVLKADASLRFKEGFEVSEDTYFWIRLAERYVLGHLPESLTFVRLRGSNAASDVKRQLESRALLYPLVAGNPQWFKSESSYFFVKQGFGLAALLYRFLAAVLPEGLPKGLSNALYKVFYAFPYLYLKSILKMIRYENPK